jgi:hypothetical protein
MQLGNTIEKARQLVASMSGPQASHLRTICLEIRDAQDKLNIEAAPFFADCMQRCKGMCCRNIHVNEIVNMLDMIYILTMMPDIYDCLRENAHKERIFSADCLFLDNGTGPCIFPPNLKPERCIITFCSDTVPIKKEIKSVRAKFSKLSRYTKLKRPFIWIGF